MEKRLLLAVVLMTAVIMLTNVLFPPPEPPAEPAVQAVEETPAASGAAATLPRSASEPQQQPPADSVDVQSSLYQYVFSTRGAALQRAEILPFPSYTQQGRSVQLVPRGTSEFLAHRLVVGQDTVDFSQLPFQVTGGDLSLEPGQTDSLRFTYQDPEGFGVELGYVFSADSYLITARGRVSGLGGRPARLLTDLAPGLESHEHPDHHSERELAVVTRVPGSVDRLAFSRVEQRQIIDGDLTWAGIKDKYFLAAIIAGDERPLEGAIVDDLPDLQAGLAEGEIALPQARVTTVLPIASDGTFSFSGYLGPQEYDRLAAVGFDLEEVTPYGYRWLQPVIRPLAAAVLWVLNTLHDTLGLAYGWVLVVFGVMMRVVLWPLNAKAMRAQMKNMAVQPLIQEIREKYKDAPEKQQQAMLALYKEHGFNPFAGCLPLLIPFPVLITLFFVFQNTIAFRGAGFLWLPDLSLKDPFYILPMILVVSMFALQWLSTHLSGIEQNPQMKMMLYVMPIMMGVIFFMLPAGLNLYYAVTQVASIPQQVMIAKERRKAQDDLKKSGGPKLSPPPSGGGRMKSKAKR